MNIVLTGFMASGKTSISKAISEISNLNLIDTDDMIVEKMGMSINEIFEKMGESKFRDIECEIISEVSKLDGYVISTGGGVPLNSKNIDALRKNGIVFNLSPDFETVLQRLEDARSTRPLLKNAEIEDIKKRFNDRLPFYAVCDYSIHITNDKDPYYYAREILNLVNEGENK